MGTAANGIPYPEDTDPVAQGAQAIKAVVSKVGAAASGYASLALPTAGTSNSVAITFPAGRFTVTPQVVIQRATGFSSSSATYYWPGAITTSGCVLNGVSSVAGGAATLYWQAVQAP